MKRTMFAIAAIAALAPAKSRADWEYTRWGMTPEQVAAASKGTVTVEPEAKRQVIPEVQRQSGADGTYSSDGLKLQVRFQFDTKSNGLVCVFARVDDPAQNEAYRNQMVKTHGPPQKKEGLAIIGQEVLIWNKSDDIKMDITKGSSGVVMHCKPGEGI